ncbi:threonine ammonia-lyase [Acuticoccus mangrovi]|uniref:Threonine/serine dehydratase n=1 Tax=Acuticoccus mangrovi TaxID=2796142 RepID=A0A934ITA9_9HYPH|nr:threonine/serine dehydratase [Acuticoccus mangrovi]MBJ3778340.1 threonine/serine dehydratase [Acuticoccus mangrovi]
MTIEPVTEALLPIAIGDIEAAAKRLDGEAIRTPLLASATLDEKVGARVLVKAECLQRTGSFKFRGAFNRLSLIPADVRANGVVACSSGNHAQGVAEAARLFGVPATIVMPHDAPAIKRARTERSGAKVVVYDRETDDREAIAAAISERTGATFVHPYDDPGVMAGQGTIGLEIAADLAAMGLAADRVLVPVSGGGLIAGVAVAMAAKMPHAICQPVEPAGFDDLSRSLVAGVRVTNERRGGSIADALLAATPGRNTFEVHMRHVASGVGVADEALPKAMAFAMNELKIVTEPGGVIALAALLEGLFTVKGETVVVVASGGNADPDLIAEAITTYRG